MYTPFLQVCDHLCVVARDAQLCRADEHRTFFFRIRRRSFPYPLPEARHRGCSACRVPLCWCFDRKRGERRPSRTDDRRQQPEATNACTSAQGKKDQERQVVHYRVDSITGSQLGRDGAPIDHERKNWANPPRIRTTGPDSPAAANTLILPHLTHTICRDAEGEPSKP